MSCILICSIRLTRKQDILIPVCFSYRQHLTKTNFQREFEPRNSQTGVWDLYPLVFIGFNPQFLLQSASCYQKYLYIFPIYTCLSTHNNTKYVLSSSCSTFSDVEVIEVHLQFSVFSIAPNCNNTCRKQGLWWHGVACPNLKIICCHP